MVKKHCDICEDYDEDEVGEIQTLRFYAGKGYDFDIDPLGHTLVDKFEEYDLCECCLKDLSDMAHAIGNAYKHEFMILHLIKNAN